jgi:hypothetical protein
MSAELPDGVIAPRVAEIFVLVHERRRGQGVRATHARIEVTEDAVRCLSFTGETMLDLQRALGALSAELRLNAGGAA